jgi:hypothetical protein
MDLTKLARAVDAETARAFVTAARHVIDALLIESARAEQTRTPAERDYESATLSRTAPAGGWLAHGELRQTAQRLAEAIAAEKWTDGMMFALRVLAQLGVAG